MIENIHWLGHASFKITGEKTIYIDPYRISGGGKADIVLITHNHFDHCSREDIEKVAVFGTTIVAAANADGALEGDVRTIRPGEKIIVKGMEIEAVPAYNIGRVFHSKAEGNLGYVITVDNIRIYHAGDTDLIPEMKDVKADVALLPVGGTYTMNAKEAAEAAGRIKPRIAIPMHWGSVVGSENDALQFQKLCSVEVRILKKE